MRTSQRRSGGANGQRSLTPTPRQVQLEFPPLSDFQPRVELVHSEFPTVVEFHRHDRRTRRNETEDSLRFVCG